MLSKLLSESDGVRTFVVVLDAGDEAFRSILDFAAAESIAAAAVTAIGVFESATVGWFDFASKTYRWIPLAAQCEVLSAIGDIAAGDDGKPSLHLH
jgi:predicted DNA-binding protein with PD1-like motif